MNKKKKRMVREQNKKLQTFWYIQWYFVEHILIYTSVRSLIHSLVLIDFLNQYLSAFPLGTGYTYPISKDQSLGIFSITEK